MGPSGKQQCASLVTIISFLILDWTRPLKPHSSCVYHYCAHQQIQANTLNQREALLEIGNWIMLFNYLQSYNCTRKR